MSIDETQLNEYVRDRLSQHQIGKYQLSEAGADLVYEANANLGTDYAEDHNFAISRLHSKEILDKLHFLPPRKFGTCLDVCCGSGFLTLNIMENKAFENCVAVDINEHALDYLERKVRLNGISNVEFSCQNIMSTNFDDDSFDCIVGNSFLHHLPDNPRFLEEMHRILVPGGTVCFTHEPSVSAVRLENLIASSLRKVFGRTSKGAGPGNSVSDIWQYSQAAVEEMLTEAGFTIVKIVASGRVSTIFGSAVERAWKKIFRKMPPPPVFYIRKTLSHLEGFRRRETDAYSSFTICARKAEK